MSAVKTAGILLISLCPAIIAIAVYINMLRRINELKKLHSFIMEIKRSLALKSFEFPNLERNFSMLLSDERKSLDLFISECATSNSDVLTGSCDNMLSFVKSRILKAENDFNKHGKTTAASGICIGIVIFILAI